MPRGKRRLLGTEVEREIADLYRSGEPVPSIKATYELTDSVLYRVLANQNVTTRRRTKGSEEAIADLPVALPMRVQTDSNGFVERVEPVRSSVKTYTWEVRFESAMRVEAASIEAAISEVSRLPMCRRVFNVALKGSM